jgi:L-fuconolactonase
MRIDAHHHLWRYTAEEFGWIDEPMAALRRDFLPADLERELAAADIDAAVAVQARTSLEETAFLLDCAAQSTRIAGVVGWADLASVALSRTLDDIANPLLVGFREIAQGQAAGFFDRPAFNAGVRELTARGLAYDILVYANQLEEATRFVDCHPNQRFVLDHAAKPPIAAREMEPWRTQIAELARRPNVTCKVSGLVTEAGWKDWTAAQLAPYIDICVAAFTPQRILAGSDWPVCLVASSYTRWWQTLGEYFAAFSADEQDAVFGGNAQRLYQLPPRAHA